MMRGGPEERFKRNILGGQLIDACTPALTPSENVLREFLEDFWKCDKIWAYLVSSDFNSVLFRLFPEMTLEKIPSPLYNTAL